MLTWNSSLHWRTNLSSIWPATKAAVTKRDVWWSCPGRTRSDLQSPIFIIIVKTAMFQSKAQRSSASPGVVPLSIWGMHLEPKCRQTFWIRVLHGSRRSAVNMMGPEVHCVSFKGMGWDRMTCLVACICLATFGPTVGGFNSKQSIFLGWSETTNWHFLPLRCFIFKPLALLVLTFFTSP